MKSKSEESSAYRFLGGNDLTFDDVLWTRATRGVFRSGTNNVHILNSAIRRDPPIFGQSPCLSSAAGGPQFGQPRDPETTGNLVENFTRRWHRRRLPRVLQRLGQGYKCHDFRVICARNIFAQKSRRCSNRPPHRRVASAAQIERVQRGPVVGDVFVNLKTIATACTCHEPSTAWPKEALVRWGQQPASCLWDELRRSET